MAAAVAFPLEILHQNPRATDSFLNRPTKSFRTYSKYFTAQPLQPPSWLSFWDLDDFDDLALGSLSAFATGSMLFA